MTPSLQPSRGPYKPFLFMPGLPNLGAIDILPRSLSVVVILSAASCSAISLACAQQMPIVLHHQL